MHFPLAVVALFWAGVSYIIYQVVTGYLIARHNAARARELKCEAPPAQKNRWPFGIDQIVRAIKADKAQRFPVDFIKRAEDVGAITYSWNLFGSENFQTADEKNIQAILATQFDDFDLGPFRRGLFWPLLGNGIFTQDGAGWEHSRTMMRPQFVREQVSDLGLEEIHVQNMMRALDLHLGSDKWTDCVDLQELFFRLTLDSATEFLFGESVDSQIQLIPGSKVKKDKDGLQSFDFASAFDKGQMAIATRARFGNLYWLVNPKGFKEACKACHDFIDHFVRLALSQDLREKELEKGGKDKYVFLEALAAETQDPIELRSQLLHILLAGRDTTASLLGWLFLCLSKDSTRYQKLRNICLEEFGTYDKPKAITFSKLKSCQYLQHCNNEALRLYPVVPINGRFANKDTTLPRGGGKDGQSKIFVPAGSSVDYSVHVLHHRKDIWGPDAEDFRPERWENRKVGWEFVPFNGGPRICIGQQFALTEASYVTVRLLQRFDKMESMETDPIVRHNLTLTNCSGNGVKVRAHAVRSGSWDY
ncbi:cytochrome P450 [Mollisia scopiformis]|uniref:Cytochrome P450 n=1 Tax=Mollisia scopiformis TaxID=149040 RepID=A0A194WRG7_MOLSC|nr:cytochrome P450 [Mollisia scopiformis]KUJ10601.1 cytochrome P450 [Mollisia scopiformis]